MDALQIVYELSNGSLYTAPRRGGGGGGSDTIRVDAGEKIIGAFGSVFDQAYISHLYFLKRTSSGGVSIYGPYGTHISENTFVALGSIKSIYGRHAQFLNALGFYFDNFYRILVI